MRAGNAARQESAETGDVGRRLRAVVAGDPDATAWLYDTFAPALQRRLQLRYAYPGGPDPEDLLQDAFVFYLQEGGKVLADFLARVPPPRQTRTALERHLWDLACGLASNRRRAARRARARATVVPLAGRERRLDAAAGAERRTVSRDVLERLDRCLEESGRRPYLYFTLRYRDGLAPEEIVRATGWSKKSTYRLKQRVDAAVRACAESLGLDRGGDS